MKINYFFLGYHHDFQKINACYTSCHSLGSFSIPLARFARMVSNKLQPILS